VTKSTLEAEAILKRAAPLTHQQAHETQPFGHLVRMPIALSEQTCKESVENLNQLLADTRSPSEICREEAPVQIPHLLHAHEIVLKEARTMARRAAEGGDDGTNDLLVSDVIRRNELQVWFVAEHVVDVPLTTAV
jgi:DNA-binding ferritin-like protein